MKRLGGWQQESFSVDLNNNIVSFVRYVDSYPILGRAESLRFTQIVPTRNAASKNENFIANRTKWPYSTKGKKVTVVGGRRSSLKCWNPYFVMNEIEDIRIGYSWTISSESVQIAEFTPTWYIKRNGTWKTLAELKAVVIRQNQRTDRKQREVTQMDFKRSAVVLIVCLYPWFILIRISMAKTNRHKN